MPKPNRLIYNVRLEEGVVSAGDYEREVGWAFDADEAFHEHLTELWSLLYGELDPQLFLSS